MVTNIRTSYIQLKKIYHEMHMTI